MDIEAYKYEERNNETTLSSSETQRRSFVVTKTETAETRRRESEEWKLVSFDTVIDATAYVDGDYTHVMIEDKLYISADNLDMYLQLLQDIKDSGILAEKK